ncbi:hypothetical protein ACJMK2_041450 [Sinanodonta woodiana]|uniref:Uncharacterized protein n=1 Tax=Sinanodonta woodiana TaxID=1069815 RepID=A0ABD3W7F9_SINWO
MCDHHNTILVFLVIVCSNGSIANDHNVPNAVSSIPVAVETRADNFLDDRYLRTRSGFINFIIDKGCSYVSGYVRMKYVQDRRVYRATHNASSDHVDWERNVINAGQHFHVPSEFIKALITCGQNYSMAALFPIDPSKPHDQVQIVGKRHFNGSDNDDRHQDNDYYEDDFGGNHSNNTIWDPFMNRTTNEEFSKNVGRMCTSFCSYVKRRYHLDDIPFKRFSMSWLLDVYKMVMISHVRIEYIHGLVGCGMEYALTALNAPNWLTRFYHFALAMEMYTEQPEPPTRCSKITDIHLQSSQEVSILYT